MLAQIHHACCCQAKQKKKKNLKKDIPNQICLHLRGVPSVPVLSRRDMGMQPSAVSSARQEHQLGHLGSQGSFSAGKGALQGGWFFYSDTLNVYLPMSDVFRQGEL